MDPATVFFEAAKGQGLIVIGMGVLLWLAFKYLQKQDERKTIQEDAREKRYNDLVDQTLANAQTTTKSLAEVVASNTSVLSRVEAKLDAAPGKKTSTDG